MTYCTLLFYILFNQLVLHNVTTIVDPCVSYVIYFFLKYAYNTYFILVYVFYFFTYKYPLFLCPTLLCEFANTYMPFSVMDNRLLIYHETRASSNYVKCGGRVYWGPGTVLHAFHDVKSSHPHQPCSELVIVTQYTITHVYLTQTLFCAI